MTDITQRDPETEEPLILERLSDLCDQKEFLSHYPDIRGRGVINPRGDEVGVVDDLYVNPRTRQVEMAAIGFSGAVGSGGKHVLIPIQEIVIAGPVVEILTREERVNAAPEFHAEVPNYEPYYEYWGTQVVGEMEEIEEGYVRPPGRLELEGEDEQKAA
jgi:sporulation protein YlmC with PRC-barrel domain